LNELKRGFPTILPFYAIPTVNSGGKLIFHNALIYTV